MKNNKYPRYFTNVKEKIFWQNSLYVFLERKHGVTKVFPGKIDSRIGHTEEECDENVKSGYWREITVEEAVLL